MSIPKLVGSATQKSCIGAGSYEKTPIERLTISNKMKKIKDVAMDFGRIMLRV